MRPGATVVFLKGYASALADLARDGAEGARLAVKLMEDAGISYQQMRDLGLEPYELGCIASARRFVSLEARPTLTPKRARNRPRADS